MSIRALVFDVDGTIADTEEVHREAFNAAFEAHGLNWHWSRSAYAELLNVSGGIERMQRYLQSLSLPDEAKRALAGRLADIHRTKVDFYKARVDAGKVAPRSGVRRLIDEARHAGLRLAVATTGTAAGVEALIGSCLGREAMQSFDIVAGADVVSSKKPAPEIYRLVLQRLDVSPAACVAFEDSARGVGAAHAAGLFVVATPTFWTLDQDFSRADLLLPTLGDPDQPIPPAIAARRTYGMPYVTLALLERLQTARAKSGTPA